MLLLSVAIFVFILVLKPVILIHRSIILISFLNVAQDATAYSSKAAEYRKRAEKLGNQVGKKFNNEF